MQAENQGGYSLLYSLRGFRYCDLLLAGAERAAWCVLIGMTPDTRHLQLERDACHAVAQRAQKMFEWRVPSDSLLTIALDHLTLGRPALCQAILERSSLGLCHSSLESA